MMGQEKFSILLYGAPHSVWPVAALLSQNVPKSYKLIVVENGLVDDDRTILTMLLDSGLLADLDVDPKAFVMRSEASMSLGYAMEGWQGDDSRTFLAPSGELPRINGVAIHQIMLRAALLQNQHDRFAYLYQPFRFCARAAETGKLSERSGDTNSPLSLLAPIVHIDAEAFAGQVKKIHVSSVDQVLQGRAGQCELNNDGRVSSIEFEDGTSVSADLFIDLSGDLAGMISTERQAETSYLPFDRVIEGSDRASTDHPTLRAIASGILTATPAADDSYCSLHYCADEIDDEQALDIAGQDGTIAPFAFGMCEKPWSGNLLRMGKACGDFGPMPNLNMLALQEQAKLLVRLLPAGLDMKIEARNYCNKYTDIVEEIRDFALLPFFRNQRNESLWQGIRAASPPESLGLRIKQFEHRGRFVPYEEEVIDKQSWIEALITFCATPAKFESTTLSIDMKRIIPALKSITDDMNCAIDDLPSRASYLSALRH